MPRSACRLRKPRSSRLYLKGSTGQGKTHLLHAIANGFIAARPGARVFYCSAERFMIEFVQAMRQNEMIEFKSRLRSFDMLLVDDIQFIIGKASTQEEFLHTIDALLSAGKRLVVAADRAPQALDGVEQRLLSRLSMGLVADIQAADIELRRQILEHRLSRFTSAQVPQDVVEFLARTINRNVRELVGGLNKLRLCPAHRPAGEPATGRRAVDRYPLGQPPPHHDRRDPAHGVPVLSRRPLGNGLQAPRPRRGASAPGGDVPGQGAHPGPIRKSAASLAGATTPP
jgi:CheY-like chemotaxis protein